MEMNRDASFEPRMAPKNSSVMRKIGKAALEAGVLVESGLMVFTGYAHYDRTGQFPSPPELIDELSRINNLIAHTLVVDELGIGIGQSCTTHPSELEAQYFIDIHEDIISEPLTPHEAANRYGQTLAPRDEVERTYQEIIQATDPEDALHILSNFTQEQYGFHVVLYRADEQVYYTQTEILSIIENEAEFLQILSLLPKELFAAIDLKEIAFAPTLSKGDNGRYYGYVDVITIDPSAIGNPSVLLHEIGHAVNDAVCGGTSDGIISRANPDGNHYQKSANEYDRTVFASRYGRTNSSEDSAEIVESWLIGSLSMTQQTSELPIGEKLSIIQDRWESINPGIVAYMESIIPYFVAHNS